jgi:hypothetical protein
VGSYQTTIVLTLGCTALSLACLSAARWIERHGVGSFSWLFPIRGRWLRAPTLLALYLLSVTTGAGALLFSFRVFLLWFLGR